MPLPGVSGLMLAVGTIRKHLDTIEAKATAPEATSGTANDAIMAAHEIHTPLAKLIHMLGNGKDFIDGD